MPATLSALANEIMLRQMQQPHLIGTADAPRPSEGPMRPEAAALLGGIGDAASTYAFLKKGAMQEDNALYKPLGNNPLATSAAVFGTSLAMKGARALLRHYGMEKLADALAAMQGAEQVGLASKNVEHLQRTSHPSSDEAYYGALLSGRGR